MGRSCKGIDPQRRILVESPLVSRDHAEINWIAGHLQITDNSRNGTWVNDIRMTAGSSKALSDGDTIRVGESVFRVVYPNVGADAESNYTAIDMTVVSSLNQVVTCLVADLRGFSAYCQTHAPADVYGMINEIFDQFSKIIEDCRGTIKDYAGDSVIAFWEHQFAEPAKQSVMACQAALQQMVKFNQIRGELSGKFRDVENLRMGWGITTGPVTLSHFGSRTADLAMVGDCINLASRFSGMANKEVAEKILICSHTAELVQNQFELKDLGKLSIRGRQGRERIFALIDT